MKPKTIRLAEYLEKIKNNKKDTRLMFFYSKKLNEMLVMEKTVTGNRTPLLSYPRPASDTDVYLLKPHDKLANAKLDQMTSEERSIFLKANIKNYDIFDSSAIASLESTQEHKTLYMKDLKPSKFYFAQLNLITTHHAFRRTGIAKALINAFKNELIYDNIEYAEGMMCPLDIALNESGEIRHNEFLDKDYMFDPVDAVDLAIFYQKMGFRVLPQNNLLLKRENMAVPPKDVLPKAFASVQNNNRKDNIFVK